MTALGSPVQRCHCHPATATHRRRPGGGRPADRKLGRQVWLRTWGEKKRKKRKTYNSAEKFSEKYPKISKKSAKNSEHQRKSAKISKNQRKIPQNSKKTPKNQQKQIKKSQKKSAKKNQKINQKTTQNSAFFDKTGVKMTAKRDFCIENAKKSGPGVSFLPQMAIFCSHTPRHGPGRPRNNPSVGFPNLNLRFFFVFLW
jgi:hypothetical protein